MTLAVSAPSPPCPKESSFTLADFTFSYASGANGIVPELECTSSDADFTYSQEQTDALLTGAPELEALSLDLQTKMKKCTQVLQPLLAR